MGRGVSQRNSPGVGDRPQQGPDTEQRPVMLTVSVQEYHIADVCPCSENAQHELQHGATLDR
jgi:hypothetical protein